MAWTAPRTWVSLEIVTAALLNTGLRDNLLETGPALVSATSQWLVSDGANSLVARTIEDDTSSATMTSNSTSYIDLASWTSGAEVSVTVTTGTRALVLATARLSNDTAGEGVLISVEVSGASTKAYDNTRAARHDSAIADATTNASMLEVYTALTAGSNKFEMGGKVSGGVGTVAKADLIILPF